MFNAIDSVPLTAIAFFMLTGELMTSATITDRLVALSRALIGRIRGGLAQVNVLVSMFFAGMNGSVVADTATVGALVLPAMKKAGYPAAFSAAVTGVSSTIGGIIPPSIMMIVLANSTEISREEGGRFFPKDFKKIEIPTAAAIFPAEMSEWPPRSYVERIFNLKQWTEMPAGGHFAALEKPDLLIDDIKKFSRTIRFN